MFDAKVTAAKMLPLGDTFERPYRDADNAEERAIGKGGNKIWHQFSLARQGLIPTDGAGGACRDDTETMTERSSDV